MKLVTEYHFDPSIADLLLEDWDLRDSRPAERDELDVEVQIHAAAGRLGGERLASPTLRVGAIDAAVEHQSRELLTALLIAEYAGHELGQRVTPRAHVEFLTDARSLAALERDPDLLARVAGSIMLMPTQLQSFPTDLRTWLLGRLGDLRAEPGQVPRPDPAQSSVAPDGSPSVAPEAGAPSSAPRVNAGIGQKAEGDGGDGKDGQ